jgi:hypothetical protein
MSLSDFKNAANLAGFSKILGAPSDQFILLDRDTDGRAGRPIFINGALASKFDSFGSVSDMTYTFERLKQLRALAGGMNSYSNVNDAMEHMRIVGRAKVTYKLIQNTNEPGKKPGVYITDVDLASFSDGEAGVYKVNRVGDVWKSETKRQKTITSRFAAINGLCNGIRQAATEIMPPLLAHAYRDKKWQGNLNSEGFDLFYNPPSLHDNGKQWKTPAQKRVTKEVTAKRLADALVDSQRRKQPVQWVIHGNGTKVMKEALERLSGADLSGHTVLFMAPTLAVADILPLARHCKMQLHDSVMQIHDDDDVSKAAQFGSGAKLERELKAFGLEDKGALLRGRIRKDTLEAVAGLGGAGSLGLGVGTFLTTGAFSAGAALGAAPFLIYQAQSIRNRLATPLTNPAYNPHLNPHMSVEELNLAAKKASGSLAKTFVDVVKARIKR